MAPQSDQNTVSTTSQKGDAPLDARTTRVRRLIYQASYTGMKETDLLLGHFAKHHLASLSDPELGDFEQLLDAGDGQIYAWVMGNEDVPPAYDTRVLALIKAFNKSN